MVTCSAIAIRIGDCPAARSATIRSATSAAVTGRWSSTGENLAGGPVPAKLPSSPLSGPVHDPAEGMTAPTG